jgi:membrane protein
MQRTLLELKFGSMVQGHFCEDELAMNTKGLKRTFKRAKNSVQHLAEQAQESIKTAREKRAEEHEKEANKSNPLKVMGALAVGGMVAWATQRGQPKPEKHRDDASRKMNIVDRPKSASELGDKPTDKEIEAIKQPLPLAERERFRFTPRQIFGLLKETLSQWNIDKAPQLAAALSYYTIFSLAPLLIIVIAIVGLVYSQQDARAQIMRQVTNVVGSQGGEFIQSLLDNASQPASSTIATILGLLALFGGAAGVMGQLKNSLNTIWNVEPPKPPAGVNGILWTIKRQIFSFTLVLGVGFLLLVSLVISTIITAVGDYFSGRVPDFAYHLINFALSFGVITLLFAAIYRVLPDARIAWRDVWIGATLTSLLFTIGKFLLGLYLGRSSAASSYGAAGSLVIVMLWVYYSAQILFFGAELTQVYANQYGDHIVTPEAHRLSKRAKQEESKAAPQNTQNKAA